MMNPYDYRVEDLRVPAFAVCEKCDLNPYDTSADGIERWRVVAIDLYLLRAKLEVLRSCGLA